MKRLLLLIIAVFPLLLAYCDKKSCAREKKKETNQCGTPDTSATVYRDATFSIPPGQPYSFDADGDGKPDFLFNRQQPKGSGSFMIRSLTKVASVVCDLLHSDLPAPAQTDKDRMVLAEIRKRVKHRCDTSAVLSSSSPQQGIHYLGIRVADHFGFIKLSVTSSAARLLAYKLYQ